MIFSRFFILVFLVFAFQGVYGQSDCSGGRYADSIFTQVNIQPNILYFQAFDCDSVWTDLHFDFYEPTGDTFTSRPVIIFTHGGSFVTGDKTDNDIVQLSTLAARMGYVGIALNYRLESFPHILASQDIDRTFKEAVYRATIDQREVIKFLRNSVNNGNPYRINPNQIIVTGVSAGAIMAVHTAFLDGVTEIPTNVSTTLLGTFDTVGNFPQISGLPDAIVSIAGGIGDTSWITPGEDIPGLYIHGTIDSIVPYNSDSAKLIGIPITYIHGSQSIYFRTLNTQVPAQLKLFPGVDHYGLGDPPVKDTIVELLMHFYPDLICNKGLGNHSLTVSPATVGIFPNPAQHYFQVKVDPVLVGQQAILYDNTGKAIQVVSFVSETTTVQVQHLSEGFYYLKMPSGKAVKIILQ